MHPDQEPRAPAGARPRAGMSTLSTDELRALARSFAGDEAAWRPHVAHRPDKRVFRKLLDTEAASVWMVCWSEGQETGLHDHDGSAGAVQVVAGAVHEERLGADGQPRATLAGMGDGFAFGGDAIHGVRHAGTDPAVTIHAYSPPLRAMGTYSVDADGVMRRERIDEYVELRPAVG